MRWKPRHRPAAVADTRPARVARRQCRALAAPLLLLALAAFLSACSKSPEAIKQEALKRGEQYFEQRKYNEAVIEFESALKADENFVAAHHALGRTFARKYWFFDAVRELGRALVLAPDSVPIMADYGQALSEVGDWEEAEKQAAAIIEREPQNARAQYIRAAALLGRGKAEEALRVLELIPSNQTVPEVEPVRALALLSLGKQDQAEQLLRAALARDSADARALAGLGAISLTRRDYKQAKELYAKAKELVPEDARIRLGLAAALARLGDVPAAIAELNGVSQHAWTVGVPQALGYYYLETNRPRDAIELLAPIVTQNPRFRQARLLLAVAYLSNNDPGAAETELLKLEQQAPGDPAVQFRLAQAETLLGRASEALARLDKIAGALGKIPEYQIERARALSALPRPFDDALAAGEAARRLAPQSSAPYLLLGEIRARQGNLKAAREMFTRAVELGPAEVAPRIALGRLLLAEGEADAALREFEAAVKSDPRSIFVVRDKVGVLVQEGRLKEAVSFVEAAVKADPKNRGFHSLLGGLYLMGRDWDKASRAFAEELELAPHDVEARMGLATIAIGRNHEDDAVPHLRAAVEVQPDLAPAVVLLNTLYAKQGRADLAVPIVEAAVKAAPRQAIFTLLLGDLYLKTGRYDDAIALMTDALRQAPSLLPARLIRAEAQLGKGSGTTALKELQEVARENPKSAEVQYLLAHAFLSVERMPDGFAAYREAIRLDPDFETARVELAMLSGQADDESSQRARLEQLQDAVKQDPHNVLLREALARAFFVSGLTQPAQSELRQILEMAPLHLGANFLTAQLLLQQGKADEAARYLERVLRTNPSHVESNVLLAQQLARHGRYPDAIQHLETAIRADPGLPQVKAQLGNLYIEAGRLEDAAAVADDLERTAAGDAATWLLKGRVRIEQRNPKAAVDALNTALLLKSGWADAHRLLGQAYETLQKPDRAVEQYRRAIELNGSDAVALNNLAWVLAETLRTPNQALPLALKAVELAPQSPYFLDTLGWVQYRRRDYTAAEKALSRATELLPSSAPIHYHLGMAYYRLGRKTDALYSLRRAIQLDPKLAETEKLESLLKELNG